MYDNSNTLTLKQDSQNEGRDQQKEEDEETIGKYLKKNTSLFEHLINKQYYL